MYNSYIIILQVLGFLLHIILGIEYDKYDQLLILGLFNIY